MEFVDDVMLDVYDDNDGFFVFFFWVCISVGLRLVFFFTVCMVSFARVLRF